MSIELKFKELEAYLFVEASGPFTKKSVMQAIEAVRNKAEELECTRILIDARKVSEPDVQLTRYYTGEYFAEFLPVICKNCDHNYLRQHGSKILLLFAIELHEMR